MSRPLALLFLLAAVPIVLAYLRPLPLARQVVPSLIILRRLAPATETRARLRTEDWPLLLALLLGLVAATAALVLPTEPTQAILVLDDSASMGSQEGDGTRLDLGRRNLGAWLDGHPDVQVSLVVLDPPAIRLGPTRDHPRVRAAMAASVPADGPAADPLPLLQRLCADAEPPVLVVASDRRLEVSGCEAVRVSVGAPAANSGITALAVRPPDALGQSEVFVELSSTDGAAHEVSLLLDDRPVGSVSMAPGPALARLDVSGARRLTARIETGDGFVADDEASVLLDAVASIRAVLVTSEPNGFLEIALREHPRVALEVVSPDAGITGPVDLLVLEAARASRPEAKVTLAFGAEAARALGLASTESVRRPAVDEQADDDVLRFVDVRDLEIEQSALLNLPPGGTALVTSDEGILAARSGDLVVFGFGPDTSALGLDVSIVHLVANAVDLATPPMALAEPSGILDAAETLGSPPDPTQERPSLRWTLLIGTAFVCCLIESALTARRR